MILYMSDEAHRRWLAGLEPEEVHEMQGKNLDMQTVIRQQLQHMGSVSHIIVEAGAVRMDTWEPAAEALQITRKTPLLLLTEDAELADTFIRKEHYDILNRAHKDVRELVRDWIAHCLSREIKALNHIWIAIAGLTPGCGTTALALHLAAYIQKQGQEVSVTERANVFRQLAEAYSWEETAPDSYQWGGIVYNHNQIDEESPFTIFDLGVMASGSHEVWKQCQVKILVADGKPYRISELEERLKELQKYSGEVILAFTFVPEAEKPALRKKYAFQQVRVWFVPMEPDLFLTSDDYGELVQGYVKPVPEEQKPKKVISFRMPKLAGKKNQILVGGIILLALWSGFGLAERIFAFSAFLDARKEQQMTQVAVESIPRMDFTAITRIRLMLAEEQAEQTAEANLEQQAEEGEWQATEEAVTEVPESEGMTEALAEGAKGSDATGIPQSGNQQNTQSLAQMPTGAEAPATEAPRQEVSVPLTPSLKGYQGQIYTGSQVVSIMNKFAGQPVAMHLITRSSDGWYNYSVGGGGLATASAVSSGTAMLDTQCSFLCQVVQVNGEDVGLEFVQQ
ncbi:MAG: hypothetical protein NC089_09300 [Bacteroides sp.]|nr:hypothetical protein [Bacteroides sp.]MCM1549648.1 hypothetical protein [Clostridium sp.]